jgi:O-antigen/teichoic acid export membrane protein
MLPCALISVPVRRRCWRAQEKGAGKLTRRSATSQARAAIGVRTGHVGVRSLRPRTLESGARGPRVCACEHPTVRVQIRLIEVMRGADVLSVRPSKMSFWRQSLRNSLVMVSQAAGSRVIGLLSNAVLARMLLPAQLGSLQAVTTVATVLTQTLKLSVDGALQVRLSESHVPEGGPGHRDFLGTSIALLTLLSCSALVIGFWFSSDAARWFGDASLTPFMGFAGLAATAQLVSQFGVVLIGFGEFRTYAAIQLYGSLGYAGLLVLAYVAGARGLTPALAIFLVSQVATSWFMTRSAVSAWRARGLSARFTRMFVAGRELLLLGLPLHLSSAIPSAVWLVITAGLARTWGVTSLADLRVVGMVNQIVGFVPHAIAQTFITQFAAARGASDRVPAHHFMRYVRVIIATAMITALGVTLFAPLLIALVFGPAYASTSKLVAVGLMTAAVLTLKQAILVGLVSERRSEYALSDTLVSSAVCAGVARVLIPTYGTAGFLASELVAHLAATLTIGLAMAWRMREAKVGRQALAAITALLYGLLAMLAGYLTHDTPSHVPLLIASIAVGLLGFAFGLFDAGERSAALLELRRITSRFRRVQ